MNNIPDKLKAYIDEFLSDLDKLRKDVDDSRKLAEKRIEELNCEKASYVEMRHKLGIEHKKKMDELKQKEAELAAMSQELSMENNRLTGIRNDMEQEKKTIDRDADSTRKELELAVKERERAEKAKREYEIKIDHLGKDFGELDKKRNELLRREAAIRSKEKDNLREEEKLTNRKLALDERELRVKGKEERLEIAIKKAKLDE